MIGYIIGGTIGAVGGFFLGYLACVLLIADKEGPDQ